jgi:hypothetical protein
MYEADRETKHKAQTVEGRATELLQTTDAADLVRLIDAAKEIVRIEDTGDEDTYFHESELAWSALRDATAKVEGAQ